MVGEVVVGEEGAVPHAGGLGALRGRRKLGSLEGVVCLEELGGCLGCLGCLGRWVRQGGQGGFAVGYYHLSPGEEVYGMLVEASVLGPEKIVMECAWLLQRSRYRRDSAARKCG